MVGGMGKGCGCGEAVYVMGEEGVCCVVEVYYLDSRYFTKME